MKLLFTDVETGGVLPEKHSLLQVGMAVAEDGNIRDTMKFYVKSDVYHVTAEALSINKLDLTSEQFQNGCNNQDGCINIINFIQKNFVNEKPILVGHNVNFDKNFLTRFFINNDMNLEKYISYRMIDTMSLIRALIDIGKMPPTAASSKGAFDYFNIKVEKLHDALDDTLATVELYQKLTALMK